MDNYDDIIVGKIQEITIDEHLSLGNGLFIRNSYYKYVSKEYKNALKEKYNAEVIQEDFRNIQNINQ